MLAAAHWHSWILHFLYEVIGWIAFSTWSLSFYPQLLLNYRRKSVVGLNFDFLVFNLTKHTSYLIFNASLFFIPIVQAQYRQKYGVKELIPVSASDVAFSIHAVLLTSLQGLQILFYERGKQNVSLYCKLISGAVWLFSLFIVALACLNGNWLWLVTTFNYIQLFMTSIKYIPQAVFNHQRRSTEGWSIGNVILDFTGGIASFVQLVIQSTDQSSIQNFTGNIGKLGLSFETMAFDALFMVQHYVLFNQKQKTLDDRSETLIQHSSREESGFQ